MAKAARLPTTPRIVQPEVRPQYECMSMETVIEYVIVGGPQHGMTCRHPLPSLPADAIAIASKDGQLCRAGARRHTRGPSTRMLLLHPKATGEQFRTMLAAA